MISGQPPSIPPYQGGSSPSDALCQGQGGRLEASPDKGRLGGVKSTEDRFLPYNRNLTVLARENRRNPTPAEKKLWFEILRLRQFASYKFLRQKPVAGYIVDFYCSELCLVIEIDGESHADSVEYDAERTRVLQSLGLTVVRYTNDDVMSNIQGIHDHLSEKLAGIQPPSIPPCQGGSPPSDALCQGGGSSSELVCRGGGFEASPDKGRFGGVEPKARLTDD